MPEADVSDADLDRMSEEEVMDVIKAALERLTPTRLSDVIEEVQAKRRSKEAEVKEAFFCRNAGAGNADGALIRRAVRGAKDEKRCRNGSNA